MTASPAPAAIADAADVLDPLSQTPLEFALLYAKAGLSIFPVRANKKPLTPHGLKDATTDEAIIRAWWTKWPHADIAWAVPADILVVDLDSKHDDIAKFERHDGRTLASIETPTATTPSGGRHVFFNANGHEYRNGTRVEGCCDLRTQGGYVVLPGAENGREWLKSLDGPWAPAPEWLPHGKERKAFEHAPNGAASGNIGDDPAALAFLDEACTAIRDAKRGEQEATLHKKCFAVGGLVGAGRLRDQTALARLIEAANAMPAYGDPWGELTAKVEGSLARGQERPWSPRPVIEIVGGDLAREADDAEHALVRAGLPIFTSNTTLVSPVTEEATASHNRRTSVTILKPANVDLMTDWLS